jgi:hypothetical protein
MPLEVRASVLRFYFRKIKRSSIEENIRRPSTSNSIVFKTVLEEVL